MNLLLPSASIVSPTECEMLISSLSRMKFLVEVLEAAFDDECVTSPVQWQALLKLQSEIEATLRASRPGDTSPLRQTAETSQPTSEA